ncbi:hypothetical protein [Staphylococcus pasteuri]|uniref:hypothetical protein n=1 Tax=Staphylococcus pasteuri TaxID=45972 RepID=UPI002DB7EA99|nr:hypothetical protein [Staphylococcus pasteuri]MEB6208178.1 hypothetical protein [Staphylococcus pasteuri]
MIINGWNLYNNSSINLYFVNNGNTIQAISKLEPSFWVYFEFNLQKEEIIDIDPKLCSEINKDNKTIKLFDK